MAGTVAARDLAGESELADDLRNSASEANGVGSDRGRKTTTRGRWGGVRASTRTTLYDRREGRVTLNEVVKINVRG